MSSTFVKGLIALLLFLLPVILINAQVTYEIAYPNLSFEFPTEIQPSNDGSNRIFVVEQPGSIKVLPNQSMVSSSEVSTFLDISSRVSYSAGTGNRAVRTCFPSKLQPKWQFLCVLCR